MSGGRLGVDAEAHGHTVAPARWVRPDRCSSCSLRARDHDPGPGAAAQPCRGSPIGVVRCRHRAPGHRRDPGPGVGAGRRPVILAAPVRRAGGVQRTRPVRTLPGAADVGRGGDRGRIVPGPPPARRGARRRPLLLVGTVPELRAALRSEQGGPTRARTPAEGWMIRPPAPGSSRVTARALLEHQAGAGTDLGLTKLAQAVAPAAVGAC